MSQAYVDSSAILSVEFSEPGYETVIERLDNFSRLVSSNLLEAEVRAGFARDGRTFDSMAVSNIEWVYAERSLAPEFERVLEAGYLRGADLWHAATALYAARGNPSDFTFLTLDRRQGEVASALGFHI